MVRPPARGQADLAVLLCYSLILRPAMAAGIPMTLRHRMLLSALPSLDSSDVRRLRSGSQSARDGAADRHLDSLGAIGSMKTSANAAGGQTQLSQRVTVRVVADPTRHRARVRRSGSARLTRAGRRLPPTSQPRRQRPRSRHAPLPHSCWLRAWATTAPRTLRRRRRSSSRPKYPKRSRPMRHSRGHDVRAPCILMYSPVF